MFVKSFHSHTLTLSHFLYPHLSQIRFGIPNKGIRNNFLKYKNLEMKDLKSGTLFGMKGYNSLNHAIASFFGHFYSRGQFALSAIDRPRTGGLRTSFFLHNW